MTIHSIQTTFCFAILASASISSAANVRFYLAYGDSTVAGLNGSSVGDEIAQGRPFKIPSKGKSFTVQICVRSMNGTPSAYSGGCLFVGYDQANTDGRGFSSAAAAWSAGTSKVLQPASDFSAKAVALPGLIGKGRAVGLVPYAPLARESWSGTPDNGKSVRPIGLWQAYGFGLGNQLWLGAGLSARLAELKIANIGVGTDVFGDTAKENGITLNSMANATSRGCFFATTNRSEGNPGTTVKYCVTSSP